MLNPFAAVTAGFYRVFKAAILNSWHAAKADALAEIRADLPGDADLQVMAVELQRLRAEPVAALPAPAIDAEESSDQGDAAGVSKGRGSRRTGR